MCIGKSIKQRCWCQTNEVEVISEHIRLPAKQIAAKTTPVSMGCQQCSYCHSSTGYRRVCA
jgi:hypothetical protein